MSEDTNDSLPSKITIQYKKSTDYRISLVTGALAAILPHNKIGMDLFCERNAIPEFTNVTFADDNTQTQENLYTNNNLVREVLISIQMDYSNAVSLHKLMGDLIVEMEQMRAKALKNLNK